LTVAGSIAGSGVITAYVCEEVITVAYTSSSTATTIGDDLEASINGRTHLPLTASNSGGTVTLTSKVAGTSQNGIYRIRAFYSTAGGATLTASAATLGTGVEGTTTENANLTALLATLDGSRFYYMGFTNIATADFTTIRGHVATKNEPLQGMRGVAIVGAVGTISATQTLAIAENSEFVQVVWQKNSNHDPAQLVGNMMGVRQKREQVRPQFNFDGYSGSDWFIQPAYSDADWPTPTDADDAVTDGVTPIGSNKSRSNIIMSVNTRSKNSAGTIDDFRAAETHRLSVMHLLADTLVLNDRLSFSDFSLRDDERLADGTVNPNQRIGEKTLTPSTYRRWVIGQLTPFFDDEMLQNRGAWRDSLIVRIDPLNNSRLQVGLSGRTIDLRHQVTFKLNETTPN
jgi:phage tail sheath gpL-like